MPLDTGDLTPSEAVVAKTGGRKARRTASNVRTADELAGLRPVAVVLSDDGPLGSALRAARETLGLEIEDIAQATRIRERYVAALEASDFDALPSRPFAIGYARAYARALGLEPDAVAARYLAEAPRVDEALRAPIGLQRQRRRLGIMGASALMIVCSLTAWNVARHVKADTLRHPILTAHAAPPAPGAEGPAHLGAPLPPPPEATTPPAYRTPGLGGAASSAADIQPGARFVAGGAIYGSAGGQVILQARKATSLIVRGPGGAVAFARALSPGEAWRAPADGTGLTVDVTDPSAVEVFAAGVSKGALPAPQTPVAKLAA